MINDVVPQTPSEPNEEKHDPQPVTITPDKPTASFQTPEQVAAQVHQTNTADSEAAAVVSQHNHQPPNIGTKAKLQYFVDKFRWSQLNKQQRVLAIVAIVVLVAATSGGVYALSHHKKTAPVAAVKISKKPALPPVPLVSTLTGLPINDAGINHRPVTGVMIENSDFARPQSGLNQMGVIFEAVAEAGITRFLALYQDTQPSYIGPVRSARPYYVQWDLGFDAPLAHVGGSPEALNDINSWNVRNLDEFANSGGYERISSRFAPHNVYTSATQLNQVEASKGFNSSTFTGFPRKADAPSKTPNGSSIDISISSADYNSHYDYDPASNTYKRSEGGSPHMEVDASGNKTQITPKVVLAMVVQQGIEPDVYHSSYNVTSSGQVAIFQDGMVTIGNWQKTSNTAQLTFSDAAGKPIPLNAGQTWIVAVGDIGHITYK